MAYYMQTGPSQPEVDLAASRLIRWFDGQGRVLVAFSGGADSGLVLAAAVRALGRGSVAAATAVSASLATGEYHAAGAFAESLGVEHLRVETSEMDVDGYRENGPQRCYFCKATLLDALLAVIDERSFDTVVTGTNADDVRAGFRPGIRAAAERGARTPLADLDFTKVQVRNVSAAWGLQTSHKPAMPCLSSRIAYGIRITPARLARVDAAESAVRQLLAEMGLSSHDLRVRDLGEGVRVEVDAAIVEALRENEKLAEVLSSVGFRDAAPDVRRFSSGSLNAAIAAASPAIADTRLRHSPRLACDS